MAFGVGPPRNRRVAASLLENLRWVHHGGHRGHRGGKETVPYNDGNDESEGDCLSPGVPTVALVVVKTDGLMESFSVCTAPWRLE
jgi:hypothetical protein